MSNLETIARLRELMKQTSQAEVDWDAITEQTAIQSLGFDSLSILDLVYDIQQAFGLEFEAADMVGIETVGQLAEFLQAKTATP
jgi:acyl carrier protein